MIFSCLQNLTCQAELLLYGGGHARVSPRGPSPSQASVGFTRFSSDFGSTRAIERAAAGNGLHWYGGVVIALAGFEPMLQKGLRDRNSLTCTLIQNC